MLRKLRALFAGRTLAPQSTPRRRIHLGEEQPSYPVYAIGDVHGCLSLLKGAEERIAADIDRLGKKGLVVLLGDYVDRGPHSAGVISHLMAPSAFGLKRVALCGNHDDVFASLLDQPEKIPDWISFGGRETLMSYGIDFDQLHDRRQTDPATLSAVIRDAVPTSHITFLQNMPICLQIGKFLFVHAGLRPGIDLDRQSDEDMMWIREPFLTNGPELALTVIHGHTPSVKASIGPGRIGIDTQAYSTGELTVLRLLDGSASILPP